MSGTGESRQRCRRRSKPVKERNFPISLFGECVEIAARGIKPGQWLSNRIGCTERQANYIIAGKCKPPAIAVLALNGAFFNE